MYQWHQLTAIHLSRIFGFQIFAHSAFFWPTALKLGCITNFDRLFFIMGFISLDEEIKLMLIGQPRAMFVSGLFIFSPETKLASASSSKVFLLCQ